MIAGIMAEWVCRRLGDSSLTVEYAPVIEPVVNARVIAIGERIRSERHPGVRDVIEGYCTVTVVFDPLRTDVDRLHAALEAAAAGVRSTAADDGPEVTLPVCYGGRFGPDLGDVAARSGCSEDDVVGMHSGATYRVYLLGFLPGFAYLGSVPRTIVAPRRSSPRLRVPAGAVGIAGRQTGVYPLEAPGGWQLIGRCPVRMFDPSRPDPFRLQVGNRVRFRPVDETEYVRVGGMVSS